VTATGWRITALHHVAIAHGDDPACEAALTDLLGPPNHSEDGPGFIERMYEIGGGYVQTLEASGDGVVSSFLDKRGPGLHHVALRVEGIDAALTELRERGVRLIDAEARPGGMGTRIAFVHPSAMGGVLVELVEERAAERAEASDG
jgi:methylmalonyl-CoA/ethylmalonyl-CoA epimerase